jgi:hypothetical protein
MKLIKFSYTLLSLMLCAVLLHAQPPGLPRDGADPDAITMTCNISNANRVQNIIHINPGHEKSVLYLTITPAFKTDSNDLSTSANAVYKIKIMNNSGSVVQTATIDKLNWQADLHKLNAGTYILQVINTHDSTVIGEVTFVKPNSLLPGAGNVLRRL